MKKLRRNAAIGFAAGTFAVLLLGVGPIQARPQSSPLDLKRPHFTQPHLVQAPQIAARPSGPTSPEDVKIAQDNPPN